MKIHGVIAWEVRIVKDWIGFGPRVSGENCMTECPSELGRTLVRPRLTPMQRVRLGSDIVLELYHKT